jgi:hypothetical protein
MSPDVHKMKKLIVSPLAGVPLLSADNWIAADQSLASNVNASHGPLLRCDARATR